MHNDSTPSEVLCGALVYSILAKPIYSLVHIGSRAKIEASAGT